MLSRMASLCRALLASVVCTGLGIVVPPSASAAAGPCLTCTDTGATPEVTVARTRLLRAVRPAAPSLSIGGLAADGPEFVAPAPIVPPARPITALDLRTAASAADAAPPARVLDVAPKTSPPA